MDRPRLKPTTSDIWTSRALTGLGVAVVCLVPIVGVGGWATVAGASAHRPPRVLIFTQN